MEIQWYPGHMAKAKRIMKESLPLIDVVIELLDARIPLSSKNPEIDGLAVGKKRLVVLNKTDMADDERNKEWGSYFREQGYGVVYTNSLTGEGISEIYGKSRMLMSDKLEKMAMRGRISAPVRAMVVGIPNVGKSAFINKIIGKKGAAVANRPGVTKSKQWLKLSKDFELLDTPGILWPKFEDKEVGIKLALTGAIKDELLDKRELCHSLFDILSRLYPSVIIDRYGIKSNDVDADFIIAEIAEKRGHKIKGGELDLNRTYAVILDEFRKCKIGRLTLESPGDYFG